MLYSNIKEIKSGKAAGIAYFVFRIVIGIVFIWAGSIKLMDPKSFGQIISQYRIVPEALLPVIAIGLPLIELLAGIGLVIDKPYCLSLITLMILMFIVILWFGILKNLEIDCGCFSSSEQNFHDGLRTAFKRDWGLLFMSFFLYFYRVYYRHKFIF